MTERKQNTRKETYLHKKDILLYYYNTYVGLAIVLLLIIAIKFDAFPILLSGGLIVIVLARIVYGIKKLAHVIACPFCGDGARAKKWASNAFYLASIPLEKPQFRCPNCGKYIEVRDHED